MNVRAAAKTSKSSWEKPEELMSDEEKQKSRWVSLGRPHSVGLIRLVWWRLCHTKRSRDFFVACNREVQKMLFATLWAKHAQTVR